MSDLAIKHEKHSDNEEDSDDETEGADEIIDSDSETGKALNDRAVHGDQDDVLNFDEFVLAYSKLLELEYLIVNT